MSLFVWWIGALTLTVAALGLTWISVRGIAIFGLGLVVAIRVWSRWKSTPTTASDIKVSGFFGLWWFVSLNPAWGEVFLREQAKR